MKRLQTLQQILICYLIFLLPFNIRHIFNFDQIKGILGFREHISYSIYLIDILFIIIFLISLTRVVHFCLKSENGLKRFYKRHNSNIKLLSGAFILILFITASFANNPNPAFYNAARVAEAIIFGLIAQSNFKKSKQTFTCSVHMLITSGIIQGFLAIWQFVHQKSMGLYILGESHLGVDIPGIAKFQFEGEKFIRAYGTFPHANVLSAFLLLTLAAALWFAKNKKGELKRPFVFLIGFLLIFFGIVFSYSRSGLATASGLLILFFLFNTSLISGFFKKIYNKIHIPYYLRRSFGLVLFFGTLFLAYNLVFPRMCLNCQGDVNPFERREFYNHLAYHSIAKYPIWGVGPGNIIFHLDELCLEATDLKPWQYQPIHNLFLLITAETGLIGLMIFLLLLFAAISPSLKTLKQILTNPLQLVFVAFLCMSFFDHYFWTLPQGQFMFWTALAFFVVLKENNSK